MIKLMLTNYCNMKCSYCFAAGVFQNNSPSEISLSNVQKVIDYLAHTPRRIRLLGGEPTLHSQFEEVINLLDYNNFKMQIFTNGIMDRNRAIFIGYKQAIESVIINLNEPSFYTNDQKNNLNYFINACKNIDQRMMVLGHNIYKDSFDGNYILETAEKYNIKTIRLGFSNPLCSSDGKASNMYLSLKNFKSLAPKVVQFIEKCFNNDIKAGIDCVIPLCVFTDEELGILYRCALEFHTVCISNIDIGTDLKVYRCFATSNFCNDKYLTDFKYPGEILEYFDRSFYQHQTTGGFKQCDNCKYHKLSKCQGGCIGYSLMRRTSNT